MSELILKVLIAKREKCFLRIQRLYDIARKVTSNDKKLLEQFQILLQVFDDTIKEFESTEFRINEVKCELDESFSPEFNDSLLEMIGLIRLVAARKFPLHKQVAGTRRIEIGKSSEISSATLTQAIIDQEKTVKLPRIDIPSFNGRTDEWPGFYELFKTLIHDNKHLSDLEKLQYLVSKLHGPAANICKTLNPIASNYLIIWNALFDHYNDDRSLADEKHLRTSTENSQYSKLNLRTNHSLVVKSDPSEIASDVGCTFCGLGSHEVHSCPKFLKLSPWDRYTQLKQKRICLKCFSSNHRTKECKVLTGCSKCDLPHHTLLHFDFSSKTTSAAPNNEATNQGANLCSVNSQVSRSPCTKSTVVSATVVGKVLDSSGRMQRIRMLVDSGSQYNFLALRACRRLRLPMEKIKSSILGFGGVSKAIGGKTMFSLSSLMNLNVKLDIDSFIVDKIVDRLPSIAIDRSRVDHLRNLDLADPNFVLLGSIDGIIGAEFYSYFFGGRQVRGSTAQPIAIESPIGFVLVGKAPVVSNIEPNLALCCAVAPETAIENLVKRFWDVEEVSSSLKSILSPEDIKCEEVFSSMVKRQDSWRFKVHLPFREEPTPCLDQSFEVAKEYQVAKEKRLSHSPEVRNAYNTVVADYMQQGHASLIAMTDDSSDGYFIPHHYVFIPQSLTTPLSMVFNARAKTTTWKLLNEILFVGPKLQSDIVACLGNIEIPRHIGIYPEARVALVWFSDASMIGYGSVLNFKIEKSNFKPTISFVKGKSKVSTSKILTIELCAPLLFSKLVKSVVDLLRLRVLVERFLCFTDSQIVLHWIRTSPDRWQTFVANRVVQIQENNAIASWFHVDGKPNPADCLSRGLTPSELGFHPLWGNGPPWLLDTLERWPIYTEMEIDDITEVIIVSLIRQKYWMLAGRQAVRKRVRACNVCFKLNPKPNIPKIGDLPAFRVAAAKPFVQTGVDYAGPIHITLGRIRKAVVHKAYICLFICLATKADHLELCTDLSTQTFLAAFKRLLARMPCKLILSDCGTNFVGAKTELNALANLVRSKDYKDALSRQLEEFRIEWKFSPPNSPQFGGIWEANIKVVKSHLFRVIGKQNLTYEELNTVLIQIEALLNCRPLSSDPTDLSALTPAHFLTLTPLKSLPANNILTVPENRLSRFQLLDQIVQSFWTRWKQEYLHELQVRAKWTKSTVLLKVGTVVIVDQPNSPPLHWPLGIVEEVLAGKDGVVRVAVVRTSSGVYKRPATKLYPLPSQ